MTFLSITLQQASNLLKLSKLLNIYDFICKIYNKLSMIIIDFNIEQF